MDVGVVAVPGCFDSGLTGVLDVLRFAELLRPGVDPDIPPITTTLLSMDGGPVVTAGGLTAVADRRLDAGHLDGLDVLVVPGLGAVNADGVEEALDLPANRHLVTFLREQPLPATLRLASACTGAFVLGEAGVLDGRRATTTWWLADAFRRRYRRVDLVMEQMVVWSGPVTTAGAAFAHIDLALSLALRVSPQLASATADLLLIDGRSARSIEGAVGYLTVSDDLVSAFESYVRSNIDQAFTVTEAAAAIGTTRKTLERRTRDCIGISPHDMVRRLRLERARHLRRVTTMSMDEIALLVGYRNASTLRALLRRRELVGLSGGNRP